LSSTAYAQYEGLTEPYRQIALASDETGVIEELLVSEGDVVQAGQVIARLNDKIQKVQLELAEHLANSTANLVAAEKSYEKRKQHYEQIKQLQSENFANVNELARAELELDLALSKWLSAQDEVTARKIEHRRALIQFENRQITAPFDAVVSLIHRRKGEFVSPINSEIVTLVDDSRLFGVFNIPSSQIEIFEVGKKFTIMTETGIEVTGTVEYVSNQIDSQSSTIEVRLLIENRHRRLRPGTSCSLNI
jgi:RND family efflux transporter MFP subunit